MNTKVKKLDIKYKHESAYKKEISELKEHFKEHLCIEKEKAEHL